MRLSGAVTMTLLDGRSGFLSHSMLCYSSQHIVFVWPLREDLAVLVLAVLKLTV